MVLHDTKEILVGSRGLSGSSRVFLSHDLYKGVKGSPLVGQGGQIWANIVQVC